MRFLDGLRGVAALIVAVHHFMAAFFHEAVPDLSNTVPRWVDSPLGVLCNGPFWVYVFFVLSGYVLGRASHDVRTHLWRDILTRYFRLALPACASVVLAWCLLSVLPLAATRLNDLVPNPWFGYVAQDPIPPLLAAIRNGLVGIFRKAGSPYNNVLWTMQIELIGSVAVYAFFQFCRWRRGLAGAVVVLGLVLTGVRTEYVAFALGAGLSLAAPRALRWPAGVALPVFALGLLLGSAANGFAERHGLVGWPVEWRPGDHKSFTHPLGALAIVVGVLGSGTMQRLLESPVCRWLGRLSFPIYLVHVPLLYTVFAAAAVRAAPLTPATLVAIAIAFLVTVACLAVVFERAVDKPVLAMNRRISRWR